jgi:predicted membrane-bound spermidine synthase
MSATSETVTAVSEKFQYGQQVKFEIVDVIHMFKTSKSLVQYAKTRHHGNILLMDDEIQYSTQDEHRYHEMLVSPVFDGPGKYKDILILGGGDGLAARTLYDTIGQQTINSVTIVDWDPEFVEFAKILPESGGALTDPRTLLVFEDALAFVRKGGRKYDAILMDLPDPDGVEMENLYRYILYALPPLCKQDCIVVSHVGPVSLDNHHPCWDFIRLFHDNMMETLEYPEITLNTRYIPSYAHEWAVMSAYMGRTYPQKDMNHNADIMAIYDSVLTGRP